MAENVTYRCAHIVFPNSLGLKKFIERHFRIAPNKLRMLGNGSSNGIDTVFFDRSPELEIKASQLRADYNIGKQDIVFSFVGRIVGDKGIVELVQAFRELTLSNDYSHRNIFLLLVGHFEDELDPLPVDILDFFKNDKHVILPGFQSDIRPWIVCSDVFVFPSYREGFPNVVMQAGLLRVPCIVSDINGCNEIVKNGSTGVVVQVKNVSALVQAMETMMDDELSRKRFADAAHDFVASSFKREIIWEALRKEYLDLLKSPET
jgi:glycosyltransferase involved in cell wall biosynthesis